MRYQLELPTRSRPRGSTCCRSCPSRCSRRCTRARRSRSVPTTSRRCSRWRSSRRRCRPSRGSTSPARCSTSCGCGGRRRSCAPTRLEQRARHAGAHLLQGRVGVARGFAQAEHRGAAGVLQQGRGHRPRLTTETGAGQWGTALSFACAQFDLECKVYMVRASYEQKPYRKILMETWGARGRAVTGRRPDHPGSLGLAISDAVRDAATPRRHALLARLGAQPRAAAPDGHRARGEGAARARGRDAARRRDRRAAAAARTSAASRCRS